MLNYQTMSNKNLLKLALSEKDDKMLESMSEYFGSLSGILIHSEPAELEAFGLPKYKIEQLKAFREISRRLYETKPYEGARVTSPDVVFDILRNRFMNLEVEVFTAVLLDTKNQVIDVVDISSGTLNCCVVHPRDVFKVAIRRNSNCLLVSHNHPSNDTTPSAEDINITKRLVEAGNIIGIKVLDHIIVGKDTYLSMKEKGLI